MKFYKLFDKIHNICAEKQWKMNRLHHSVLTVERPIKTLHPYNKLMCYK